jgi:hypothetical protein
MIVTNHVALDVLLTGSTHYMRVESGDEAIVYYADRSRAHMAAPSGKRMQGSWRLTETGYTVDWEGGPSASWQIDVEPGRIVYRDGQGAARGEVTRIVPGDAANLAG